MPNLSFICIPATSNIPMNGNDPQLITPCSVTLMIQNGCYIRIGTNYMFSIHLLYGNNIPTIFEID